MKEKINIVWFKRDFRLSDHQPLCQAVNSGLPTLLIAFLEPSLMQAPQSDVRHWRFIVQSVKDMNTRLIKSGHHLFLFNTEVVPFLQTLSGHFQIRNIFSYAETGIAVTYERDKKVKEFCEKFQIRWIESPYAGVIRGIKRRKDWPKYWYSTMAAPTEDPDLFKLKNIDLEEKILNVLPHITIPVAFEEKDKNFQEGGESKAQLYLSSFLSDRVARYSQHISKPLQSRKSCSRLSPYLAWGNVSMPAGISGSDDGKTDLRSEVEHQRVCFSTAMALPFYSEV